MVGEAVVSVVQLLFLSSDASDKIIITNLNLCWQEKGHYCRHGNSLYLRMTYCRGLGYRLGDISH